MLGHAAIARAIAPIKVATGEMCQNRVIFKQLLQAGALGYCQVDACRVGGVNEVLAILLLAAKFGVPVCPHAGGVGLCEYVQHLAIYDYVALNPSIEDRYCEYVDHLHEHFVHPVRVVNARYQAPLEPGYSIEMKAASLDAHEYPGGSVWRSAEWPSSEHDSRPDPASATRSALMIDRVKAFGAGLAVLRRAVAPVAAQADEGWVTLFDGKTHGGLGAARRQGRLRRRGRRARRAAPCSARRTASCARRRSTPTSSSSSRSGSTRSSTPACRSAARRGRTTGTASSTATRSRSTPPSAPGAAASTTSSGAGGSPARRTTPPRRRPSGSASGTATASRRPATACARGSTTCPSSDLTDGMTRSGFIGFQVHQAKEAGLVVKWRNIRLKELAAGEDRPRPEHADRRRARRGLAAAVGRAHDVGLAQREGPRSSRRRAGRSRTASCPSSRRGGAESRAGRRHRHRRGRTAASS